MNSNTSGQRSIASWPESPAASSSSGRSLVVGVGDCKVSADPASELVTYALGSCMAVAIWDPVSLVGGMLHFMLPEASADNALCGHDNPCRYADTGTPLLFRSAYQNGADKRRLVVRLAGGASVMDSGGIFKIGKRNYAALRRILWKAGVMVHGEDVGGTDSRTVRLEVGSGRLLIRRPEGRETEIRVPARRDAGGSQ